jgi:hypothetical protein
MVSRTIHRREISAVGMVQLWNRAGWRGKCEIGSEGGLMSGSSGGTGGGGGTGSGKSGFGFGESASSPSMGIRYTVRRLNWRVTA